MGYSQQPLRELGQTKTTQLRLRLVSARPGTQACKICGPQISPSATQFPNAKLISKLSERHLSLYPQMKMPNPTFIVHYRTSGLGFY